MHLDRAPAAPPGRRARGCARRPASWRADVPSRRFWAAPPACTEWRHSRGRNAPDLVRRPHDASTPQTRRAWGVTEQLLGHEFPVHGLARKLQNQPVVSVIHLDNRGDPFMQEAMLALAALAAIGACRARRRRSRRQARLALQRQRRSTRLPLPRHLADRAEAGAAGRLRLRAVERLLPRQLELEHRQRLRRRRASRWTSTAATRADRRRRRSLRRLPGITNEPRLRRRRPVLPTTSTRRLRARHHRALRRADLRPGDAQVLARRRPTCSASPDSEEQLATST